MTNQASIIDVNHVLNICQRRCGDMGVTVTFNKRVETAMTDGKNIILPTIKQPITQTQLDNLYGYVIHECGHHLRSEAFAILAAARPPEHLAALYNIAEDDGMERERAMEWRGDRSALSNMNNNLITTASALFAEAMTKGTVTGAQQPEPLAAMMLYQLSRLNWDDQSEHATASLLNVYPDKAKVLTKELIDEGWVERFRTTVTPHDTWDLAVDLAKRLYPNNKEQEYEDIRKAGHSKQQRDNSNDTISVAGQGGNGQGEKCKVEAVGSPKRDEGRCISWKDAVISEHTEWTEREGEGGSIGIDWKGYKGTRGQIALMPTNLINVVDMSTYEGSGASRGYGRKRAATHYMGNNEQTAAFANSIRRYIQAKARSKVNKEQYEGKLDGTAIVRLMLPPIDGGEYNKRIFYNQRKHTLKDTAIFVLTDWSGSMEGNKMRYAADASQRLVHTFDRVLNVPVALATFSTGSSKCDIGYIKKFTARGTTELAIAKRFADFYAFSAGNNDADAVHWAYNELRGRRETRKILIVLSDGCPAGSWAGDSPGSLKYVTSSIEKHGKIELYGVGICSGAVSQYYTNHKVLNDPANINETLFNIIKEGNNVRH